MSNVLLLGDQTADQQSLLRKLVLRRKNALLTTFHEQVSVVLREETSKLPAQQRKQIPNFLALNTLVEAYYTGSARLPILESTFVALTQLSHHIAFVLFSEPSNKIANSRSVISPKIQTNSQTRSTPAFSDSALVLWPLPRLCRQSLSVSLSRSL